MKQKQLLREILGFSRLISIGNRKILPVMLLGGLAKALSPFLGLFFSARILNKIIDGEYAAGIQYIAVLLVCQLAAGIIEKACNQAVMAMGLNSRYAVDQKIAAKAFEMEYERFEKQETMDTIRRMNISAMGTGGVDRQVTSLYEILNQTFSVLCSFVFVVVLFFQVDESSGNFFTSYGSTLILMGIYGIILLGAVKSGAQVEKLKRQMWKHNDHTNSLGNYLYDAIMDEKNAKDIRVFQMQDFLGKKYEEYFWSCLNSYVKTAEKSGLYLGINGFIGQLAAGISYLFVGAKAFYGIISIGDVMLYAGAVNRVMGSLIGLIDEVSAFLYRNSYLRTYDEFIRQPAMSYDGTLPIEKRDDMKYEFEFHNVSFSYPGSSQKVLNRISLKFNIGETMAVVGRNGAGKTTLIKLLCRLYEPVEGCITLNKIDIRKYDYQEYTQIFSVVFQDFQLFSLPLEENIAAGSETDEERVWEVLDKVSLKDRVKRMEQGIHSRLFNNNGQGIDISGGEAQRLAIARALYKNSPFVILDEPTAALDPLAEAEIYENFNQLIQNKTAIYISHRMSSCKFCDKIVVLDKGEVTETGTHKKLLEENGIYAALYKAQAQYYA